VVALAKHHSIFRRGKVSYSSVNCEISDSYFRDVDSMVHSGVGSFLFLQTVGRSIQPPALIAILD
jgi:hypothetical protein